HNSAGRAGLEAGRPSYLAELHGTSALILRRVRRGDLEHAGVGRVEAYLERPYREDRAERGLVGKAEPERPGVALGAGRGVDIPAQREPVAFVEPDPDAIVREARPPVPADRQEGEQRLGAFERDLDAYGPPAERRAATKHRQPVGVGECR